MRVTVLRPHTVTDTRDSCPTRRHAQPCIAGAAAASCRYSRMKAENGFWDFAAVQQGAWELRTSCTAVPRYPACMVVSFTRWLASCTQPSTAHSSRGHGSTLQHSPTLVKGKLCSCAVVGAGSCFDLLSAPAALPVTIRGLHAPSCCPKVNRMRVLVRRQTLHACILCAVAIRWGAHIW